LTLRLTRGAATNNNLCFAACLACGGIGDVDVRKAIVVPRIASVNIALTTGALPRSNVRPSGVGVHSGAIEATRTAIKRIAILNILFTTVRHSCAIAVCPIRLAAIRLNNALVISRNRFAGKALEHMAGIGTAATCGSEAIHVSADTRTAMSWKTFVNFTAVSWRIVAIGPFRIASDDLASLIDTTEGGVATSYETGRAIRRGIAARN